MEQILNEVIEMINNPEYKDIEKELKLLKYYLLDYMRSGSREIADDMILLLLEIIEKTFARVKAPHDIFDKKFKNNVSASFYNYMVLKGLSPKTANDYVNRVNKICDIEKFMTIDVKPYIESYTAGENKELNKRLHNAPSSALKKFEEFKTDTFKSK